MVRKGQTMKQEKLIRYTNVDSGETKEKVSYVDMQFDDDEGYLFWKQKGHVKTFLESPLPSEFTWAEKGRVGELKHYMLKDNQLLVYRSGSHIKPLGVKELCRILELSERQCKAFVKKMKHHRVIIEIKTDGIIYFAFNPVYGLKVKRITLTLFLWFQQDFLKVLPTWVIQKFLSQAKELKPDIQIIK